MRKLRITSFTILFIALSISTIAFAKRDKQYEPRSFRISQVETIVASEGSVTVQALRTRLVKANGEWKEFKTNLETNTTVVTGSTAEGEYYANKSTLNYTGPARVSFSASAYNAATYKSHPQLDRTERTLGYQCYVLRSKMGDDGYMEQWVAPQFGRFPIKLIIRTPQETRIIEPISVEFTEVTDEQMKIPDLQVSFEGLKRRLVDAESKGQKQLADSLKKVLEMHKQ